MLDHLRFDWTRGPASPEGLARLEQRVGPLPADYRAFLARHDGAAADGVFEYQSDAFDLSAVQVTRFAGCDETEPMLAAFFEKVDEANYAYPEAERPTLSPAHLPIALGPGPTLLLLSLDPADYGAVYAALEQYRDLDDPSFVCVAPDLGHFFAHTINRRAVD